MERFTVCLDERSKNQILKKFKFIHSNCRVIIATVAFSLGIDIPDIQYVLHWGPSNLITYWQEVGRAGRDGRKSNAILFVPKYSFNISKVEQDLYDVVKKTVAPDALEKVF